MSNIREKLRGFENLRYTGYIWMSNAARPIVLDDEPLPPHFGEDCNPFAVTAELYCAGSGDSFHIQHVGGETLCSHFRVPSSDFDKQDLKAYDFYDASRRMKFLEYWEESPSESCLGMTSLVFTKRVFVGFANIKEA